MPVFTTPTEATMYQAIAYNQQAAQAEADATNYRAARDTTIRTLNAQEPDRWTVKALALQLGLSASTIRRILG